jgi:prepilin-type N-terminal cleavage/methylation domain-containing protein
MSKNLRSPTAGFTLIEMLVVVVMAAILTTIISGSWKGFINRQKLNQANEKIYWALQEANRKSQQENSTYRANFQISNGKLQFLVQKGSSAPDPTSSAWQTLEESSAYSIDLSPSSPSVTFNYKGQPLDSDVGKKIIVTSEYTTAKRCVVVSTLLGKLTSLQDSDCN